MTYVYNPGWDITKYNVPIAWRDDVSLSIVKNNISGQWTLYNKFKNVDQTEAVYIAFKQQEDAMAFKLMI